MGLSTVGSIGVRGVKKEVVDEAEAVDSDVKSGGAWLMTGPRGCGIGPAPGGVALSEADRSL